MERSKRSNRGQNYARWAMEARLQEERAPKRSKTKEKELLCSCGANKYDPHDARELVECENCLIWQHKHCEETVAGGTLPDPHYCFRCQARENDSDYEDGEADEDEEVMDEQPIRRAAKPKPKKNDPAANKVRQSVITALNQVFTKAVPLAIEKGLLDAKISQAEYANELAREIEGHLFGEHSVKGMDPGPKYREKFRSLLFNLKDGKNQSFQFQVVAQEIKPEAVATLSAEEMLNPELRKLADQVKLESIQGSILKEDTGPRVRKTHKGDEIIENEDQEQQQQRQQQPQQGIQASKKDSEAEPQAAHAPKIVEAQYDNMDTFNEDLDFSPMSPRGGDEDGEVQQEEDDFEKTMSAPVTPTIWSGTIKLENVATSEATAVHLNTHSAWTQDQWARAFDVESPELLLKGRVGKQVADEYLTKVASEDRVIAAVAIQTEDPTLFEHYLNRGKYGVLPQHSSIVKDAYLVPVHKDAGLPQWLQYKMDELAEYFVGNGLLLGVFVLPRVGQLLR